MQPYFISSDCAVINESNWLTELRAIEKPFLYLRIYCSSSFFFNWEDDSKVNIPEPFQSSHTSPPSVLPPPLYSYIYSLWLLHIKNLHRSEKSNLPQRWLFLRSRFDIILLLSVFSLLCLASLTRATPITRQETLFAIVISSSDHYP